jgi:hypothetical protein
MSSQRDRRVEPIALKLGEDVGNAVEQAMLACKDADINPLDYYMTLAEVLIGLLAFQGLPLKMDQKTFEQVCGLIFQSVKAHRQKQHDRREEVIKGLRQ